jgi:hypothetical protein
MERMTKTSIANLKVADRAGFDKIAGTTQVMVWVERNGNRAYLCGTSGPLQHASIFSARHSVRRIRPDLEPTEI